MSEKNNNLTEQQERAIEDIDRKVNEVIKRADTLKEKVIKDKNKDNIISFCRTFNNFWDLFKDGR